MRLFPALPLILVALGAAPLSVQAQTAAAATEGDAAPAPVEALPAITVVAASIRPMTDRIIASGLVGPVEEVQVAPLIEGQPIEALLADVGDRVEAGQVLARLSNSTLELQKAQVVSAQAAAKATVAQAEAQLVEAESSAAEATRVAERTNKLREQGTASQAQADTANANAVSATARVSVARQSLEAARAQVDLQDAQLANIELQLSRTEVKAPVAGVITARNATLGAIASAAGKPMFVMERDGALELMADVAEADVPRLKAGQTAELRTAGSTGAFAGTVRLVEPTIDTTTRLGRARITLEDGAALRSGMFAEAEIIVDQHDALVVPVTAVGSDGGDTTVMRVSDGLVSRVVVTTGIRADGFVEVLTGLSAGDQVVLKAGSFVRDGDRIAPVLQPATN